MRIIALLIVLGCGVGPYYSGGDMKLSEAAERAVSPNKKIAEQAIEQLRLRGEAGVEAFVAVHERALNEQDERVEAVFDQVCGQKDCNSSRLFWYTDFDAARARAEATGRPILSLRLLGRLDEEFSCANSRFFRKTLYSNNEVSDYMRNNYVLHWKSVRPAPRVTVDFGDGRKLERTITGNSIHYVMDADGRIVNAMPGLVGARVFLRELEYANGVARETIEARKGHRYIEADQLLAGQHRKKTRDAVINWNVSLSEMGVRANVDTQTYDLAELRASIRTLNKKTKSRHWERLGEKFQDDSRLDSGARNLIRRDHPDARSAGDLAPTKRVVEDPMIRHFFQIETSIATDTARNTFAIQPVISAYIAENPTVEIETLNQWVYANVFLTPDEDPWLGLTDGYSALEDEGRSDGK